MKIDLCFSGWLRKVELDEVTRVSDGVICHVVSHLDNKVRIIVPGGLPSEPPVEMTRRNFIKALNDGTYAVSLANCIDESGDSEINICDFDDSDDIFCA